MNVRISDRDVLGQLHPAKIAGYLRATGWKRVTHETGRYSLWVGGSKPTEVLLPLDSKLGDFIERIANLLADLQATEGRSQLEIFNDITTIGCDIYRFRRDPKTSIRGTIPIEAGAQLVASVHDFMLYGATAEDDPRRSTLSGRRSEIVAQFMSHALLGQTEVSSFVVKAQIPVPAELQADLFPELEPSPRSEPFERRAGIRLMTILDATREAALESVQTGDARPFTDILQDGATVGLYNTIVQAQQATPTVSLEVDCSWSRTRPLVGSAPGRVVFDPEIVPAIRSAASHLQERLPREGVRLIGVVERLEREAQQSALGDLAIRTVVERRPCQVRLTLQVPEYDLAIAAFQTRDPVAITGDLVKHGRYWHLENPTDLQVIVSSEQEETA